MAQRTIIYWRDIPAQVVIKRGRKSEKRELPEVFQQAIDQAAMVAGAKESDAYLAEWRRGEPEPLDGAADADLAAAADAAAADLAAAYPKDRLVALAKSGGHDHAKAA
ncbi:MAG: virulence factor [Pseudomonadota bacterium]